jgi:hypothetical protein
MPLSSAGSEGERKEQSLQPEQPLRETRTDEMERIMQGKETRKRSGNKFGCN